jgi:hypothetical protein
MPSQEFNKTSVTRFTSGHVSEVPFRDYRSARLIARLPTTRTFPTDYAVAGGGDSLIFRANSVSKMRGKQRGIARFVSFCIRISHEHGRRMMGRREPCQRNSGRSAQSRLLLRV